MGIRTIFPKEFQKMSCRRAIILVRLAQNGTLEGLKEIFGWGLGTESDWSLSCTPGTQSQSRPSPGQLAGTQCPVLAKEHRDWASAQSSPALLAPWLLRPRFLVALWAPWRSIRPRLLTG